MSLSKYVYHLSHLVAIKLGRISTKMRVVFDASAKYSERQSQADQLLEGKNVPPDVA